jgi:hypothetical protein
MVIRNTKCGKGEGLARLQEGATQESIDLQKMN